MSSIKLCTNSNLDSSNYLFSTDTLLTEAKFWVFVFNLREDILCYSDTNSQIDSISFILRSKKVSNEFIEYYFDFFKKDTSNKCYMVGSKISGIGFDKRDIRNKFPIYSGTALRIMNTNEIANLFNLAEKEAKKKIREEPHKILINEEFREFAKKKGYL